MGTQEYIFIGLGLAVLLLVLYFAFTAKKRLRARMLSRVRRLYGNVPGREYTDEELSKIRTYFDLTKKDGEFVLDDITWNDLDLDGLFVTVNHCYSSVGDEQVYKMLRTPVFDPEELKERERLIRYFDDHQEVREAMEVEYALMGRPRKFSIAEYVTQFQNLELRKNSHYFIAGILLLIGIGILILEPLIGVLLLLIIMGVNIYRYYNEKSRIEPYYVSLSAISYLVNGAEKISAIDAPELSDYFARVKNDLKPVHSLTRDMFFLGSGSSATGGNILQIIMDYLRMITHFDFIKFNSMVKKIVNHEEELFDIMEVLGKLEAMISVSSFRKTLPYWCTPEFEKTKEIGLEIQGGYHPLLPEPVANSFSTEKPMLITGSNASGKSTFLKMTALNLIFGQSLDTCFARELKSPYYRVFSSMALRDDLLGGESYYVVEVRSIKRILDAVEGEAPVAAFVDEILRGTNTVERIAASSEVLKHFEEAGAMVFAATHDIELTYLLEAYYKNAHFTEDVEDDAIYFSYQLMEGRATSRNAIKLLSMMGYEKDVVDSAEKTAEHFLKEGEWQLY